MHGKMEPFDDNVLEWQVETHNFSLSGCTRCGTGLLSDPGMEPNSDQTACVPW